jgi:hypothetical protein
MAGLLSTAGFAVALAVARLGSVLADAPPLEKASDETVLDEQPNPDPCGLAQFTAGMKATAAAQMVTSSPRWGRIIRVDFTVPGEPIPGTVNRMMCWSQTGAGPKPVYIAIGQRITPLDSGLQH